MKRNVAAVGMTAALLFGAGIATAGAASAAPAAPSASTIALKSWHYAGYYASQSKCVADGHTAGVPWDCKKNKYSGYSLYLYY
ncbi:hypothetical protein LRS74_11650 [Streptomyces sp. LX-29]|uniref:hypothetical protein n=1 Tax=Streptomyces sp. LX-29 TaxID=2900152 RepID=UPI00240DB5AA|nr:hypothetical protein [Streptomyces sp. LX-29]WFB07636.1 hypothetical protein LRS74_11650 [Streptomyces sp. LX-29]